MSIKLCDTLVSSLNNSGSLRNELPAEHVKKSKLVDFEHIELAIETTQLKMLENAIHCAFGDGGDAQCLISHINSTLYLLSTQSASSNSIPPLAIQKFCLLLKNADIAPKTKQQAIYQLQYVRQTDDAASSLEYPCNFSQAMLTLQAAQAGFLPLVEHIRVKHCQQCLVDTSCSLTSNESKQAFAHKLEVALGIADIDHLPYKQNAKKTRHSHKRKPIIPPIDTSHTSTSSCITALVKVDPRVVESGGQALTLLETFADIQCTDQDNVKVQKILAKIGLPPNPTTNSTDEGYSSITSDATSSLAQPQEALASLDDINSIEEHALDEYDIVTVAESEPTIVSQRDPLLRLNSLQFSELNPTELVKVIAKTESLNDTGRLLIQCYKSKLLSCVDMETDQLIFDAFKERIEAAPQCERQEHSQGLSAAVHCIKNPSIACQVIALFAHRHQQCELSLQYLRQFETGTQRHENLVCEFTKTAITIRMFPFEINGQQQDFTELLLPIMFKSKLGSHNFEWIKSTHIALQLLPCLKQTGHALALLRHCITLPRKNIADCLQMLGDIFNRLSNNSERMQVITYGINVNLLPCRNLTVPYKWHYELMLLFESISDVEITEELRESSNKALLDSLEYCVGTERTDTIRTIISLQNKTTPSLPHATQS
ncbi:MAG: hypothetical protein ACPGUD_10315 [Parashewanella sp.]